MMDVLKYLAARLNEASTWVAISTMFVALHVNVDPGMLHALTIWGAAASGVLGFLIQEKAEGRTPEQIMKDGLAALVAITNRAPAAPPPPQQQGPHA